MPPYTKALEHQVAGHFHAKSKSLLGALQDSRDGSVLKPLQASPNSFKELGFYLDLFADDTDQTDRLNLRKLVPRFLGTLSYQDIEYLRLENVCLPFRFPCVADIKIGRRTYGPDASTQKQLREISKCPVAVQTGFQAVGMKRFLQETNQYVYHDRLCCRAFRIDEITHGLGWFFGIPSGDSVPGPLCCKQRNTVEKLALAQVLHKLYDIQRYFQRQRSYNMYGVSILVVYEGYRLHSQPGISEVVVKPLASKTNVFTNSGTGNSPLLHASPGHCQSLIGQYVENSCPNCSIGGLDGLVNSLENYSPGIDTQGGNRSKEACKIPNGKSTQSIRPEGHLPPRVDVRLIDFVHVYPNPDPKQSDTNFLYGLSKLIGYMRAMLHPDFICRKLPQLTSCLEDDQTTCCISTDIGILSNPYCQSDDLGAHAETLLSQN